MNTPAPYAPAAAAPANLAQRYPRLYQPAGGYVFVITWGRSGSTLLQNLLNALPGYCIRGENNNLMADLARTWATVEDCDPMRGLRKAGQPTQPAHPWYGAEAVSPDHLGHILANVFARDILNLPAGTRVAGFKEIRYHTVTPRPMLPIQFMARFFPKARFILNTRSHAGTMQSGWWATMKPEAVTRELRSAETLFDRIAAEYPDRTLRLHYDDYAGRPEALRPLYDFLGEPFDAAKVQAVMDEKLTHSGTKSSS